MLSYIVNIVDQLSQVLHFAAFGKHPRRGAIAYSYLALRLKLLLSYGNREIVLLGRRFHYRGAAGTFAFLFREVFIEETYAGFDERPAHIIDCGSNIGMSILFFKTLWPDCRITGIEASPGNFSILAQNIDGMEGVKILNRAVSSDQSTTVAFYEGLNPSMASTNPVRSKSNNAIMVDTVRLSELITDHVDLLKMDVEGSETGAFVDLETSGKLAMVKRMLIEYHHQLSPETPPLSQFLSRLERWGFDYEIAAHMPQRPGQFQDILIRAQQKGRHAAS